MVLFCAIVGPELVSRDLHSGVLPLYFSRPLRPADYALAKLAALVSAVTLLFGRRPDHHVPRRGVHARTASATDLGRASRRCSPASSYSAIHALVFGSIALLIASLMKRRAVAAGAIVGAFLITAPVVGVLAVLPSETANQLAGLVSPVTLVGGVGDWLFEPAGSEELGIGPFGPLYGLVTALLVARCVAFLLLRYRKVSAVMSEPVGGPTRGSGERLAVVRQRGRRQRRHHVARRRGDRAARAQRRRQDDAAAHDGRVPRRRRGAR